MAKCGKVWQNVAKCGKNDSVAEMADCGRNRDFWQKTAGTVDLVESSVWCCQVAVEAVLSHADSVSRD